MVKLFDRVFGRDWFDYVEVEIEKQRRKELAESNALDNCCESCWDELDDDRQDGLCEQCRAKGARA